MHCLTIGVENVNSVDELAETIGDLMSKGALECSIVISRYTYLVLFNTLRSVCEIEALGFGEVPSTKKSKGLIAANLTRPI